MLTKWCDIADPDRLLPFVQKLVIPDQIQDALPRTCAIIAGYSGGKDSDAMLLLLPSISQRKPIIITHCDLGSSDWQMTPEYVRRRAAQVNLPLVVLKNPHHKNLIDRWADRYAKRPTAPHWSSSAARYCTSEFKTAPTNSYISKNFTGTVVVSLGLRHSESKKRAQKAPAEIRPKVTTKTSLRTVWNYHPILHFSEEEVWQTLGTSLDEVNYHREQIKPLRGTGKEFQYIKDIQWQWHVAYLLNATRHSCRICVLASDNDISVGGMYSIEHVREIAELEIKTGYSFKENYWISEKFYHMLTLDQQRRYTELRENLPVIVAKRQAEKAAKEAATPQQLSLI